MELFEELRREYEFGVRSVVRVAREFGDQCLPKRLSRHGHPLRIGCGVALLRAQHLRHAAAAPKPNVCGPPRLLSADTQSTALEVAT